MSFTLRHSWIYLKVERLALKSVYILDFSRLHMLSSVLKLNFPTSLTSNGGVDEEFYSPNSASNEYLPITDFTIDWSPRGKSTWRVKG